MSQLDIDSFEHLLSVLSSYAVSPSQPAAENSVSRSRIRPIYTREEKGITMIALIARIVKNTGRSWALSGDLCVWSTGSPRLFNAISISTRYVKIGINLINTFRKFEKFCEDR